MDVIGDVRDAAVEQLYDEFLARTWALHEVLGSVTIDVRNVLTVRVPNSR